MGEGLKIEFHEGEGYLRVVLAGVFPSQWAESMGLHAKLATKAQSLGYSRMLADVRGLTERLSTPDAFTYSVLAYPAEPDSSRVAVLDVAEGLAGSRFFEHMLQNRGWAHRAFLDEAEAIAWLLSDSL